jgi:predicted aspartyl protease
VVSDRFPYLPLRLTLRGRTIVIQAHLDTGFDGDITVPLALIGSSEAPDSYTRCVLADGSTMSALTFSAQAQLGDFAAIPVDVIGLGEQPLVGRGVTDHFTIILDHGRQVIVEP